MYRPHRKYSLIPATTQAACSVELVWLVEGSLLPPRDQDMKGEGLENWVTHLTWWKTKLDSINICHLGSLGSNSILQERSPD